MNTLTIIVAVFPALMIVGVILAPVMSRRRSTRFRDGLLPEDDGAERARTANQRVPADVNESAPEMEPSDNYPYAVGEGDQYFEDWTALQDRFIG